MCVCVCVCVFVCVVRAAVGGPNEKVRFLTCNHFLSPAQGDLTTKSMVDAPPIFIVLNGVFLSAYVVWPSILHGSSVGDRVPRPWVELERSPPGPR